ncbi:putative RNA-dependent RNA polymerase [Lachnellula occidentalis]|uniref:RNA-dependent RNA polymerase n=1 Tax=Lachnellula occidentalis TaxID=215460 RepID=A0A8H8S4V9_9HELO|nr:putative RNA-dependent RNA polymerase [Lachnellula occidentalis]
MEQPRGMEVHIRNVPARSTENALRNFLKPYLTKLSIQDVHFRKPRDSPYAQLTFLSIDDARKFLDHHGQVKVAGSRRGVKSSAISINLRFLGQYIYCERSNRDANPYLLRVLAKEKDERQSQALVYDIHHARPRILPVAFQCSSVSCGVWAYVDSELVFSPQVDWHVSGTARFGERVMILTLDDGRRIDFRYTSTLEIITEDGSTPSLTFSMHEPPRFFEKIITDPIVELFAKLGLQQQQTGQSLTRKFGPDRHRLPYLDDTHKPIARTCLVYRIALNRMQFTDFGLVMDANERMNTLRQAARQMPLMCDRRTDIQRSPDSYTNGLRLLQYALSSPRCDIPFVLKFQIQKLAQDGYLSPFTVVALLPEFASMTTRTETATCVDAVRKLFNQISFPGPETEATDFDHEALIELLMENEARCKRESKALAIEQERMSQNVAIIHRAKVMPSGIHLYGPEPETNNRILRKYAGQHEFFLRVQFCDEDGQPVRFNPRISNDKIYHGRFKEVLREGINIAGRVYKFLGFSHSSLRAQSCWFMAPFLYENSLLFDRMLIQSLGNFESIRCPAKCAARIGQAFSDTRTAVTIDLRAYHEVPDVQNNGRVFSDGVGTISPSLLGKIWERLPKKTLPRPTCLQIRFKGAKGMISLDSRLQNDALVLRPSMIKFGGSNSADVEICEAAYKPLPMYLNRQFIKILEDMGVEDRFFLDLQAREVKRLRDITDNPINASSFLKRQSVGEPFQFPWLILALASRNLDFRTDGFLRDTMELTLLSELRKLKHQTRIPVQKGYHLHGLMDETGYLREGEIFCSVVEDGVPKYITGKNLIISRAPALHPGDVQLADGVMPPKGSPLHQIHNCICFSQHGARDLPSKLSGGDLDGDRYYIMWDERAKVKRVYQPADYPIQQPVDIGRLVKVEDMTDFFIQFMETDQLGRIAVQHRVIADQKEGGVCDESCIRLSEMHSTAVDFSKTGIPVDMTKLPKGNPWRPDFEAPGPHVTIEKNNGIVFETKTFRDPLEQEDEDDEFTNYRYYESNKILGKLYRAIDEQAVFQEIQKRASANGITSRSNIIDQVWGYVEKKVQGFQWEDQMDWARDIRDMYEEALLNTMTDYSQHPQRPLSELEAFTGAILGRTGVPNRYQRELSKTMKEKFDEDTTFIVNCILKDGDEWSDQALERSVACLAVSLEDDSIYRRREQLLSFKYVAAAICLREVEKLPGWEDLEHITFPELGGKTVFALN